MHIIEDIMYVVYIFIGMLKKACVKKIVVYNADNTIVDAGNIWAKNVTKQIWTRFQFRF